MPLESGRHLLNFKTFALFTQLIFLYMYFRNVMLERKWLPLVNVFVIQAAFKRT